MILRTRLLPLGTLSIGLFAWAGPALAGTTTNLVVADYVLDTEEANAISINYGEFGYTNPEGDFIGLVGQRIVESRASLSFVPRVPKLTEGAGFDPAQLVIDMLVPVIPDDPEVIPVFTIDGKDLVPTSTPDGVVYRYTLTTSEFNGVVRPGRFSIDVQAFDDEGKPVPIFGAITDNSGFFFTTTIPEPATLAALGVTTLLIGRRRGR